MTYQKPPYYLSADGHALSVLCPEGYVVTLALKKHLFSKGLTKAQAAVELMSLLGNRAERKPGRLDTLDQMLKVDARVMSLFFNEPPQPVPIVHSKLFSLDSTNVENWLRKAFGPYRDCLPPVVSSLQQEWENWTASRWITNRDVPKAPLEQVELARQTHAAIGDVVVERQERLRSQGALQ